MRKRSRGMTATYNECNDCAGKEQIVDKARMSARWGSGRIVYPPGGGGVHMYNVDHRGHVRWPAVRLHIG
jgi:hypothetical protein